MSILYVKNKFYLFIFFEKGKYKELGSPSCDGSA